MKGGSGPASEVSIVEGRGVVRAHRGIVVAVELIHQTGLKNGEPHFPEVIKDAQHVGCSRIHDNHFAVVVDPVIEAKIAELHQAQSIASDFDISFEHLVRAHVLAKGYTNRRNCPRAALPAFGKRRFRRGEKKNEADKNPDTKGISDATAHIAHIVVHWLDEPESKSVPRICGAQAQGRRGPVETRVFSAEAAQPAVFAAAYNRVTAAAPCGKRRYYSSAEDERAVAKSTPEPVPR
jgi:hypothetical protein